MPPARIRLSYPVVLGLLALIVGGACADRTTALRREVAELRHKLAAAEDERDAAYARAEELTNRMLVLRDQLAVDTAEADQGSAGAPGAVVRIAPSAPPAAPAPAPTSEVTVEGDIEYAGEARVSAAKRPYLRIEGPVSRHRYVANTRVSPVESRRSPRRKAALPPVPTTDQVLPVVPLPDRGIPVRPGTGGAAARPAVTAKAGGKGAASPTRPAANRPPGGVTAAAGPPPSRRRPGLAPAPPEWATTTRPAAVYQASLAALKRKAHAEAAVGFRRLLKAFPRHALADNARYWLGETYYDQQSYQAALAEFRRVVRDYPTGNKAPAALLKAGYCHLKLGDRTKARHLLGQVVELYPKSPVAKLAAGRLKELR